MSALLPALSSSPETITAVTDKTAANTKSNEQLGEGQEFDRYFDHAMEAEDAGTAGDSSEQRHVQTNDRPVPEESKQAPENIGEAVDSDSEVLAFKANEQPLTQWDMPDKTPKPPVIDPSGEQDTQLDQFSDDAVLVVDGDLADVAVSPVEGAEPKDRPDAVFTAEGDLDTDETLTLGGTVQQPSLNGGGTTAEGERKIPMSETEADPLVVELEQGAENAVFSTSDPNAETILSEDAQDALPMSDQHMVRTLREANVPVDATAGDTPSPSLHRPYRIQQAVESDLALAESPLATSEEKVTPVGLPGLASTKADELKIPLNGRDNIIMGDKTPTQSPSQTTTHVPTQTPNLSEKLASLSNNAKPETASLSTLSDLEPSLLKDNKPANTIMEKVANFNLMQGREGASLQDARLNQTIQAPVYEANAQFTEWRGAKGPVQMPVNIQFGQPQWANMVAERSAMMFSQKIEFAELQLDPPELGPLQVKVNVQQDQASVQFVSANAQVREALEQTSNRLRELLEQESMDLVDVDVSDQSASQEQEASEESPGDGVPTNDTNEDEMLAPTEPALEASYGVNYYV